MSTPLTSPAPTPPSGSSNPVPLRSWFKSITDWIVGLSPAGAAVYDTGWVNVPAWTNFTSTMQVRRRGRTVEARGGFNPSATLTLAGTFVTVGQLPAGFIPDGGLRCGGAGWPATSTVFDVNIGTDGIIQFRSNASLSLTSGSGTFLNIAGRSWLVGG